LNDAPPASRSEKLPDDPSLQTSQNLDYLLEDEDRSQRSGAWKYVLMLVALALAVGLGYARWSGQGFAGLMSPGKPNGSSSSSSASKPATPSASAGSAADSGASQSANPDGAAPAGSAATPADAPPTGAPDAAKSATATNAPATPAAQPGATTAAPAPAGDDAASNPSAPGSTASGSTASSPAASDSADNNDQAAATQPVARPAPKPKPSAAKPVDPVAEAEKFIYGRGAPQNCDRGMKELRPSAAKGNPKAMISLGALYATGVCAPRDLPTAYHWFALALRKQPDDQPLQDNMKKLWGDMTQPERQLAIRLSQ
jgi:TPR repeat protein